MVKYICPKCNKDFCKKSHYVQHTENKKKLDRYKSNDIKLSVLKDMTNQELNDYFDTLPKKQQAQLESFGPRDKYTFLKDLMKN